jgi:hypothetical protein
MNEYENNDNPYDDKREAIGVWKQLASNICQPDERILEKGRNTSGCRRFF